MNLHRVDHGDGSPPVYFTNARAAERFRRDHQAAVVETVDAVEECEALQELADLTKSNLDATLRVLRDVADNAPLDWLTGSDTGRKAVQWLRGFDSAYLEHYEYRLTRRREGRQESE